MWVLTTFLCGELITCFYNDDEHGRDEIKAELTIIVDEYETMGKSAKAVLNWFENRDSQQEIMTQNNDEFICLELHNNITIKE